MFITYHRAFKLSVPAALAAAAAAVVLGGLAAIVIAIVGVTVGAAWLLRAAGVGRAARRVPPQDHNTIEGVVVDSTEALSRSNARR